MATVALNSNRVLVGGGNRGHLPASDGRTCCGLEYGLGAYASTGTPPCSRCDRNPDPASVARGVKLYEDLILYTNADYPLGFAARTGDEFERWLRWNDRVYAAAVAATSPHAKAVVAEYLRKIDGVKPKPQPKPKQPSETERGIQLLDALSYAVNSGAPADSGRAQRDWEWWIQWASKHARDAVAASSPYAKAVVAETVRDLKAAGVKVA